MLFEPLDTSKIKSNPTSGHLKVEMLLQPLDTKKKIRVVQKSVQGFSASRPKRSGEHKRHAKYIGFPCVLSTSRNSKRFQNIDRQRDRGYKHFLIIHLRNSMFFSLVLLMFRELGATALGTCDQFRTSNGTADVL